MSDRDEQIAKLRKEFRALQVEAPKPKPDPMVFAQSARMAEIEAELKRLGSDIGERPADFPTRYV